MNKIKLKYRHNLQLYIDEIIIIICSEQLMISTVRINSRMWLYDNN